MALGSPPPAAASQPAEQSQLMDIGTVAAHNIAQIIGAGEDKIGEIRNAIRDEISAMSSHFSLSMLDVQDQYELEVKKLKAEFESKVTGTVQAATAAIHAKLQKRYAVIAGAAALVVFVVVLIARHV